MCNRKNIVLTFAFSLIVTLVGATSDKSFHQSYIYKFKDMAIKEMFLSNVPASIILAQGILESGGGNSELALHAKNHFGIKRGSISDWDRAVYEKYDDEYDASGNPIKSKFRKYTSVAESYADHSAFLHNPKKPWYLPLFELEITDYKGWAHGLKEAGYATNPDYPKLLIRLIEEYQLHKFDQLMASSTTPSAPKAEATKKKETTTEPFDNQIISINNLKCTIAREGETIYSVSRRTNVPTRQLIKYNDGIQTGFQHLQAGQVVFLEFKKSSNHNTSYHTVKAGESMESIAQQYGVRLYWLYSKNKMADGMQPAIGAQIKLNGTTVVRRPELKSKSNSSKTKSEPFIKLWEDAPATKTETTKVEELPVEELNPVENATWEELPTPDPSDVEASTPLPTVRYHTVERGETLYAISKKYDVEVSTIMRLNQMSDSNLRRGQQLILE